MDTSPIIVANFYYSRIKNVLNFTWLRSNDVVQIFPQG